MSRRFGIVLAAACALFAGCSTSATTDVEPSGGTVAVSGARIVAPEGASVAVLQMTVKSAAADRLVGVSLTGEAEEPFALYRSFMTATATAPPTGDQAIPRATEPVDNVELTSNEAVVFGWDGYAALLEGTPVDPKSQTVQIRLEFEDHVPLQLPVPVVAQ